MWSLPKIVIIAATAVLSHPTDESNQRPISTHTPLFPDVVDVSHASYAAAEFFHGYFTAKSLHDADAWLTYFKPNHTYYYDAAVGGGATNWSSWVAAAHYYTGLWGPDAKSYPVRILGDTIHGALVQFTDTPEVFGDELRIFSAIDFRSGLVTRQIDYWDGRNNSVIKNRVPNSQYLKDLGVGTVEEKAETCVQEVATKLQRYLSQGDADSAANLFTYDGVFEDDTLKTRQDGRENILAYLNRVVQLVPWGPGSSLQHVLGTCPGGGYQWSATPRVGFNVLNGITALELNEHNSITRLTTLWESSQVANATMAHLASLAVAT